MASKCGTCGVVPALFAAAAAIGVAIFTTQVWGQQKSTPADKSAPTSAQSGGDGAAGAQQQQNGGGFPDLLAGLTSTPGCLGVETARTASGKDVIFAWFKDKRACEAWYYSEMHVGAMKAFFPGAEHGKPLDGLPDNVPILTIASITFTDKSHFQSTTDLPISQISIELYTPLKGGVFLGSTFAPEGLEVPNMKDITPDR